MASISSVSDFPKEVCMECIDRIVTVETTEGSVFKGRLVNIDEYGNAELVDVRSTARDSSVTIEERVLVKASSVRLIHLPSEVKLSPLLDWRNENMQSEIKKSLRISKGKPNSVSGSQKPLQPKVKRVKPKKSEDKKILKLKR